MGHEKEFPVFLLDTVLLYYFHSEKVITYFMSNMLKGT